MRRGSWLAGLALVGIVAAGCVPVPVFFAESLDGTPGSIATGGTTHDVGDQTTVVQYLGVPHVFYRDGTEGDLRHAWWTGSTWMYETLDGNANVPSTGRIDADVGRNAAALLFGGVPHVFHLDMGNANVRHAWWTGTKWMFETVDGNANLPSTGRIDADVGYYAAAIVYQGAPHVFHRRHVAGDLRHTWWSGSVWLSETLDGHQNGPNGRLLANIGGYENVVLYGGVPHVFYDHILAGNNHNLRHGWWTGTTWMFETLDGDSYAGGRTPYNLNGFSGAAVSGVQLDVFYSQETPVNEDVRHAWYTPALGWSYEVLDGHTNGPNGQVDGDLGYYVTALSHQGAPHVFYTGAPASVVRHAWYVPGTGWSFQTIDGEGGPNGQHPSGVGEFPSAVVLNGKLHAFYGDGADLLHSWES